MGRFAATDLDQHSRLYYTLTSEPVRFNSSPDVCFSLLMVSDKYPLPFLDSADMKQSEIDLNG